MSFSTALSGLNAASSSLSVMGNNIANSQTMGFKESRAQFGDVYANSLGSPLNTAIGAGVNVATVAQQFTQGNIETTGNSLDLALSGQGFFSMATPNLVDPTNLTKPLEATAFTRSGAFSVNNAGDVVDANGNYLLAFKPVGTTVAEGFNVGVKTPVQIKTDQGAPTATKNVTMDVNVNGSAPQVITPLAFTSTNPPFIPDPTTYNSTTSITTYDSLGNPHIVSTYFSKTATPNEWKAYTFIDGHGVNPGQQEDTTTNPITPASSATILDPGLVPDGITMTFDASGALLSGANGTASPITDSTGAPLNPNMPTSTKVDFGFDAATFNTLLNTTDATGAVVPSNKQVAAQTISIDFASSTQFATPFTVNNLKQDGLPVGNLTGVDVDATGVIFAKYSNGASDPIGQVALARFSDSQSLSKVGGTTWQATSDSGAPIYGAAGDNNFGSIKSSALEDSNVDLSSELVKLIVAQQAYQANSQTITTQKTMMDTILRI